MFSAQIRLFSKRCFRTRMILCFGFARDFRGQSRRGWALVPVHYSKTLEQFIINERVGDLCVSLAKQRAVRECPEDNVLGFDVGHAEAITLEIEGGAARDVG